ncbi:MAG: hypothetical protein QOH76_3955 [Thermoleophilaceae bacterium]|jgi:phosphatidylserine/phosphatidylglycerophosphate/cardiolipin synthase-like enzyme|nr:hypothetical protein [Thermoleophilaceae bacterium]
MDLPRDATDGLLGFAFKRSDRPAAADGAGDWLPNFLRFERNAHKDETTTTDHDPVQAFVWGDYAVDPGSKLTYRVEARYGTPEQMEARYAVDLPVDVELPDDQAHGIYFNRGVAGSQAYSKKFHDVSPLDDADAAAWLSRGLEEGLLTFIKSASGSTVALRGVFYEFHHKPVLDALAAAAAERNVDVKLVVARPALNEKGVQNYPGEANVEPVAIAKLDPLVVWRTRCVGAAHNKFLVRIEDGEPVAVWTGSTNITDGAFYGQSNVGHLVHDKDVAAAYMGYWTDLHADTETDALRDLNAKQNPLLAPGPPEKPLGELFSPHHGEGELDWFADLMRDHDNQAVFFTAPFGIGPTFEAVLTEAHPFPVYALLDKGDDNMAVLRAVPGNEITAGAFLGAGGWHQFLEEKVLSSLNPMVKFIHTKYLLINPLSKDPLVITGSANFSSASVNTNDENMLVIRGNTRVADIYLSEFMRLFTHLYFRARVTESDPKAGAVRAPTPESRGDTTPIFLTPDDGWVSEWYDTDGPKKRERELFAPEPGQAQPPGP